MAKQKCFLFLLLINLMCMCKWLIMGKEIIPVGVVLDLNSTVGQMAESCISTAVSDFYAANPDYRTRLSLLTRDSRGDVVTATSAVVDLMKNEEVYAIIGPQKSLQAKFVIELGGKTQVPIISFSATSPSLSPSQSKYFIRTCQNDIAQVKAIATLVQTYGWREIVPIYEDSEYGNGLVSYLLDAFQEIDTRVPYGRSIPLSCSDSDIIMELNKLKKMQKSIFLVHMTASLASRLFLLAKDAGMMKEGYAWLITAGLSTLLDPVDAKVLDSMQGLLGVRPHIPMSKELENFKSKWKRNFTSNKPESKIDEVNLFGLWAYDTVFAVATAVEKAGIVHTGFSKQNASNGTFDLAASLGISEMGPQLLNSILNTRFRGLSGIFQLVKGEMVPSVFEILNVIGKNERILGYWTTERGLSRNLNSVSKIAYSNSKDELKPPIWPGDTTDQPKKLRIGVPVRTGFVEFMKVEWHPETGKPIVSGFCLDVFLAVVDVLPFPLPYEFIPYTKENRESAGTYTELLHKIKLKELDAVIGDITIVADRSSEVDFTLPFSESGITMMVLLKRDERDNMWIFLKPLSLDLWLTTGLAFIFTGLVVWALEHRINTEFRGPPREQIGTMFWFSFSTLVFAHRERVVNNWTRFVLIIWIFVVLIISQSYTASLASMLIAQRLQPTFSNVKEIKKNGYFVGCQRNSFVKDFLIKKLNFDETLLREYNTLEEYHDALSLGTHNGGVAAIFAEIPYVKSFIAKHCSKFKMVGPTYKTDGFGFAFQIGSPLVPYFSRAILNVTQDEDKMEAIERKNFGGETTCDQDQDSTLYSTGLRLSSFVGLFMITGLASMSSLLINISKFLYSHWPTTSNSATNVQDGSFWFKVIELAKHFDRKDQSAHQLKSDSRVHPASINGASPDDTDDTDDADGADDVNNDDIDAISSHSGTLL